MFLQFSLLLNIVTNSNLPEIHNELINIPVINISIGRQPKKRRCKILRTLCCIPKNDEDENFTFIRPSTSQINPQNRNKPRQSILNRGDCDLSFTYGDHHVNIEKPIYAEPYRRSNLEEYDVDSLLVRKRQLNANRKRNRNYIRERHRLSRIYEETEPRGRTVYSFEESYFYEIRQPTYETDFYDNQRDGKRTKMTRKRMRETSV